MLNKVSDPEGYVNYFWDGRLRLRVKGGVVFAFVAHTMADFRACNNYAPPGYLFTFGDPCYMIKDGTPYTMEEVVLGKDKLGD